MVENLYHIMQEMVKLDAQTFTQAVGMCFEPQSLLASEIRIAQQISLPNPPDQLV